MILKGIVPLTTTTTTHQPQSNIVPSTTTEHPSSSTLPTSSPTQPSASQPIAQEAAVTALPRPDTHNPSFSDPPVFGNVVDDVNLKSWFSDTIPVRVVTTKTWAGTYEQGMKTPTSLTYNSVMNRLADPAATGALSALTRAPSIRDESAITAIIYQAVAISFVKSLH